MNASQSELEGIQAQFSLSTKIHFVPTDSVVIRTQDEDWLLTLLVSYGLFALLDIVYILPETYIDRRDFHPGKVALHCTF
ncbi:hypothetical protein C8R45DRAFT_1091317 [Mycena sanguinolenta]|nr:hypothetical protein C8R45DRAFT_1091317 [Mycena sanguinolenta]